MPTTEKSLRAVRAALKEAREQIRIEQQRLAEDTHTLTGYQVRLTGRIEGLKIAERLVEQMGR